jgi:hypothetical protein
MGTALEEIGTVTASANVFGTDIRHDRIAVSISWHPDHDAKVRELL